ncbi:MAG TPA: hypothetical protein VLK29_00285 [Luteimonas sp.]|nr:hypothetical protein [Luteimonas sp.]
MSQPESARRSAPRWSLVLPVSLAVMLGVLAADLVKLVIRALHASEQVPVESAEAAPAAAVAVVEATTVAAGGGDAAAVEVGKPLAGVLQVLPGPSSARRDGDPRACINGTLVYRRSNGWEQGLHDDAPVRCRAGSP